MAFAAPYLNSTGPTELSPGTVYMVIATAATTVTVWRRPKGNGVREGPPYGIPLAAGQAYRFRGDITKALQETTANNSVVLEGVDFTALPSLAAGSGGLFHAGPPATYTWEKSTSPLDQAYYLVNGSSVPTPLPVATTYFFSAVSSGTIIELFFAIAPTFAGAQANATAAQSAGAVAVYLTGAADFTGYFSVTVPAGCYLIVYDPSISTSSMVLQGYAQ
jgi:hypothetical protein